MNLEIASKYIKYEPETGNFIRIARSRKNTAIGEIAGGKNDKGYIQIGIEGKQYYGHRLTVLFMTGNWPKEVVDHKNLDKADNRWINLREASHAQNLRNGKISKNNTVGYKGISKNKHGYMVRICIGTYKTIDEAIAVYEQAARYYHGEFFRVR